MYIYMLLEELYQTCVKGYIYNHSLVYDIYIYGYLSGVLQEGVWYMTVPVTDWMKNVGGVLDQPACSSSWRESFHKAWYPEYFPVGSSFLGEY